MSAKGYDYLLGRMYFRGDDGYQNFLVFSPMLSSLKLHNSLSLLTAYLLEYHMEKLYYLILTLNQPRLV